MVAELAALAAAVEVAVDLCSGIGIEAVAAAVVVVVDAAVAVVAEPSRTQILRSFLRSFHH